MSASADTQAEVSKISILGSESIHVGFHLLPYIFHTILTKLPSSTYVLVTDTNLAALYLSQLEEEFNNVSRSLGSKSRFLVYQVSPGEGAKSRKVKAEIEDWMLGEKCVRDTVILAFGGGVIGDLTGFVAATFMRGIKFVQIPTTLLAMVDSSVGGKTAIDTPAGKNLIGSFWQPSCIFVDLAFLTSLPSREVSNGMAEVIKTAAIWVEEDFAALESSATEISLAASSKPESTAGRFAKDRSAAQSLLLRVVSGSIHVKAHIVTIDERETGLRNLVNFGHTIGHAIEAVLTPTMLHGECVSVGMILEAEVARSLGVLSQVAVGRLTRCLKAYGLPVSLSDRRIASIPAASGLTVERLLDIMKVDKKNSGSQKKVVLLSRIGKTFEEKASNVDDDVLRRVLCEAASVVSGTPTKSPVVMATPGSKSISNRALILAALGKGTCRIRNLLHSDDTAVMMNALSELKGAVFSWEDGGDTVVVEGGEGSLTTPAGGKELYLQNAGTAMRFLATVCTVVSATSPDAPTTIITGNARMKQRPIGPLVDALRENGAKIDYVEGESCPPLRIAPNGLQGGHIRLAATVSSQYVSSILLCAPYAKEPITLELTGGQVISQPYIDMTIAMMKEFGISVERQPDSDIYRIPKGVYVNPSTYNVESDASSATYPLAIAAITGTTCTISTIGSSSLQGDARFAKEVLEPMGCKVEQTASSTTVTGPPVGHLKALGNVDMEPMTDAFLTASVLAAVAAQPCNAEREVAGSRPVTSRIYGIANQRVKECNRIEAMRTQLAKFGVETDEFDDGIIIYGKQLSTLTSGASVHCYDDHRVGMAFAVLSSVIPNTVLEEKRCVEKTWPNFFDDLQNKMGLQTNGVELQHASTSKSHQSTPQHPIFLIGMRGAGKTYIGKLAAEALGGEYTDADDVFGEHTKLSVSQYVETHGWSEFRATETKLLHAFVKEKRGNHIISLGGGIVETPEARQILAKHIANGGRVVHVTREMGDIEGYLDSIGSTAARPNWGEGFAEVSQRRAPWYRECSSHEFFNTLAPLSDQSQDDHHSAMRREIARFFNFISGLATNRPNLGSGRFSSFLSLTFPDITPALTDMDELTEGADAVELRVDLLASGRATEEYVAKQLSMLRLATPLPIVYSVRSKDQGGLHAPDNLEGYVNLVNLGLRAGCEFVDIEICWPVKTLDQLVASKGVTHIVASWHDWSGEMAWDSPALRAKYDLCAKYGDVVKLVGMAKSTADNLALATFAADHPEKPLLAINMGAAGQMSRILNPTLTPVTHPLLPSRAAPGQLSVVQINTARGLLGMIQPRQYYLFGSPIGASVSPTLHNTGFQALGLPHVYSKHEAAQVDQGIIDIISSPEFGGASVTIPLKLDIIPTLDMISEHAKIIGAVNTIVSLTVDGKRQLQGHNTDWQAIHKAVESNLTLSTGERSTALVIGAGGTSRAAIYALARLSSKPRILLFNRTLANAQKVASSFPESFDIETIDTLDNLPSRPKIIISTVPGDSLCLSHAEGTGIQLPKGLCTSDAAPGIAIDLAYKPHQTALLSLASTSGWKAVSGVEILCLQGFKQFELWTGGRAPEKKIRQAVMDKYLAQT
ncbi:putative aromatic amino acid family biosynthesis-related protein [Kockovaella imperatae]|uniref:Pentafunctional AROM polypeptide n=1 Tax=Kockovaella imperatae TaxID=4999 RepID=A0A1Y1URM3_9TREE|nr:putative aromatic amino acid family biosynthesis-related protein [Kockovaella imperatae]ORX39805.1 putative aromatic amino acid family biosynthesis-related protein [Kockovaella imperatae]